MTSNKDQRITELEAEVTRWKKEAADNEYMAANNCAECQMLEKENHELTLTVGRLNREADLWVKTATERTMQLFEARDWAQVYKRRWARAVYRAWCKERGHE